MDICVFGDSLPSPYFHTVTLTAKGRFILLNFNYLQIILQLKAFKLI